MYGNTNLTKDFVADDDPTMLLEFESRISSGDKIEPKIAALLCGDGIGEVIR